MQQKNKKIKERWYEMKKNNIAIIVGVIVVAIIVLLLIIFGSKKEVAFDAQGGSIVPTQEVGFMKKATRPANPTKEGYTFDNWYYNEIVYDFDTKVTKDIMLKAGWIKNGPSTTGDVLTVKFDTDGGSTLESMTVEKNGTLKKPADPTRDGYKFVAWQLDGKDYDFDSKVTKDITLKAKWEKEDSEPAGGEKEPSLNSKNFTLKVGKSKRLSVNNAKGKITWKSSNPNVASVDSNGNVKAIKTGTANITATVDGKTLTVKVTVSDATQTEKPTEKPTDPVKPTDPTKPSLADYKAVCEKIADSSANECYIRIKDKNGKNVNGIVSVTTFTGKTGTKKSGDKINADIIDTNKLKVASVN